MPNTATPTYLDKPKKPKPHLSKSQLSKKSSPTPSPSGPIAQAQKQNSSKSHLPKKRSQTPSSSGPLAQAQNKLTMPTPKQNQSQPNLDLTNITYCEPKSKPLIKLSLNNTSGTYTDEENLEDLNTF